MITRHSLVWGHALAASITKDKDMQARQIRNDVLGFFDGGGGKTTEFSQL